MRKIFISIPILFGALNIVCCQSLLPVNFDFGSAHTVPNHTSIDSASIYSGTSGFGFDYNSSVTILQRSKGKDIEREICTSRKPFYFSVKLPEGNYKVTLTLGDIEGTSNTTVKAESRRLMLENIETAAGEIKIYSFIVNVRSPKINDSLSIKLKPRELAYLNWDEKLTLEFTGAQPCVCGISIEPANSVKTIFLCGNSTVTDQNNEPWAAWGQMITGFFNEKVAVVNFAESGESLMSFYKSNRFAKVLSLIKPGDYVFVEFGHNDQKIKGEENGPFGSYSEYLRLYIDETRKKGGIPVLITSMHRRNFDSTAKVINTLGDFPDAVRTVAMEKNVPLIDLNVMSKQLYETWGTEESKKAFCHYPANTYPNQPDELKDNTHFNNYGAYNIALCILHGIIQNNLELKDFLTEGFTDFDPTQPVPLESFNLPESLFVANEKPDGN
jgi:lysophospholipase L1-like esterase